ncbi:MAG: hypothetical protein BGO55_21715 [Sphingobacteriales bacterium 50-39]|nr:hypothetical protein [Sphingobacteriales bacterium]OJW59603.1 MAG: hypothetical protein BGO55_21715 [Sphingobacteriales bacterium 50-39]
MDNKTEIFYLTECRRRIEARLGWGDSELWTSRDFELLSEKISETTDIHLSITTLKRIWGKVKYDSLPAVTTLDTLARFMGYEHWRAFRQEEVTPAAAPTPSIPAPSSRRLTWVWTIIGAAIITGILSLYFTRKKTAPTLIIDPSRYQFSSKKVLTEGLPNSVIFDYDATAAPYDSVYIQQSWDPARRRKVGKLQHQFTSVYYYPGFFKARLVIGQQVVKAHDLIIKTKGWLPIIEQATVPVYFPEQDSLIQGKAFGLTIDDIRKENIPLQPRTPWVRYSNIGNWGHLHTDSFRLEATVKNDYKEGTAICQHTEVRVLCEDGAIIIPLCNKGCVSELNLLLLDNNYSGRTRDLSFLGVDFSDWVHVVCEGREGQLRIYLEGRQVFQSPLPAKPLAIAGIDFRFQGTGRIKDVKLGKL